MPLSLQIWLLGFRILLARLRYDHNLSGINVDMPLSLPLHVLAPYTPGREQLLTGNLHAS
jgi:hypothetical protein